MDNPLPEGMDFLEAVNRAIQLAGNQTRAAHEIRVSQGTVSKWLKGAQKPRVENWLAIAEYLQRMGINELSHLLEKTPVLKVGFVGAGNAIVLSSDSGSASNDLVFPTMPVPPDVQCVEVRGESMYPRYTNGDLLFYKADRMPIDQVIGKECVVCLADGQMFIKILRRGSTPDSFVLESYNAPPMWDQHVEWASRVLFVERA